MWNCPRKSYLSLNKTLTWTLTLLWKVGSKRKMMINIQYVVYCFDLSRIIVNCMLTISTICHRTLWTWPWMMPCSWNSLNSKSQGRVGWTGLPPFSLPPPLLPPRATAWAPSMLTTTTTAALSGHPTSGARALSPNRNSYPSGPTAPWAWRSPAAACSPPSDSWRTWRPSPRALPLLCLHRQASLRHPPSQPRSHQWCPLIVTRLSCAVASRRPAAASMAASASLPMARQSCEDCTVTPSTRQSPAEPSTTLATALMAHAATSSMRTKSAEVHYHLANSRISSNQLRQQLVTSSARVSALPGSWAPHAAHLLHHSLHPSTILTWGSAVLPLFLHLLLISSPQCLVTSARQEHSSLATNKPVQALETSTTFLSSLNQRPHAVCVAMEITLTATTLEPLPAWRTSTTRTASCSLVLEAKEDSWSLLDSSGSLLRTPSRTATAAAEAPVAQSLQRSMDPPPRGSLCLNAYPCLTKWIRRERREENRQPASVHLVFLQNLNWSGQVNFWWHNNT